MSSSGLQGGLLSAATFRNLIDRTYEKRKVGALEVEAVVKNLPAANKDASVRRIIDALTTDFVGSAQSNYRKGGLIALAAVAIGLGSNELSRYLGVLTSPILSCLQDPDPRVRYYSLESMYNVTKVAKEGALVLFCDIFDACSRLAADPDAGVRKAAQLLDLLLKDIVTQHGCGPLDIERFALLLKRRVRVINPNARAFLVAWLVVLNATPNVDVAGALPEYLDGLLDYLVDTEPNIRSSTQALLREFLREITEGMTKIDWNALLNILISRCQNAGISSPVVPSTASQTVNLGSAKGRVPSFKRIGSPSLHRQTNSLSGDVKPGEVQRSRSQSINSEKSPDIVAVGSSTTGDKTESSPTSGKGAPDSPIPAPDGGSSTTESSASFNLLSKKKEGDADSDEEGDSTTRSETSDLMKKVASVPEQEIAAQIQVNTRSPPPAAALAAAAAATTPKHNTTFSSSGQTGSSSVRDPEEWIVVVCIDWLTAIAAFATENQEAEAARTAVLSVLPLLVTADASESGTGHNKRTIAAAQRLDAALSSFAESCKTETLEPVVPSLVSACTAAAGNYKQGSKPRILGLEWLSRLQRIMGASLLPYADSVFIPILRAIADDDETVAAAAADLAASLGSQEEFFDAELSSLIQLFKVETVLMRTRAPQVIRLLCARSDSQRVYRGIAKLLIEDRTAGESAEAVRALNVLLLTLPCLADLRETIRQRKDAKLFCELHKAWCVAPGALISLCFLSENYSHAFSVVKSLGETDVTLPLLLELDALVQLLESPAFVRIRLQLLEPASHPALVHALFALLMILPQSAAHSLLRSRLESASLLAQCGAVPGQKPSEETGLQSDVDFAELLEDFKQVQRARTEKYIKECIAIDAGEVDLPKEEIGTGPVSRSKSRIDTSL